MINCFTTHLLRTGDEKFLLLFAVGSSGSNWQIPRTHRKSYNQRKKLLKVNWNLHYMGKNYEDTTDQAHKKQQKEMSKEILAGRCAFSSTAIFFTILHSPHGHSYLLESTKMKAHARLRPKLRHQGAGNFSS